MVGEDLRLGRVLVGGPVLVFSGEWGRVCHALLIDRVFKESPNAFYRSHEFATQPDPLTMRSCPWEDGTESASDSA